MTSGQVGLTTRPSGSNAPTRRVTDDRTDQDLPLHDFTPPPPTDSPSPSGQGHPLADHTEASNDSDPPEQLEPTKDTEPPLSTGQSPEPPATEPGRQQKQQPAPPVPNATGQPSDVVVSRTGSPAEPVTSVDVVLGQDAGGSPVTWNVSTKGSPHAFIIGIPGQGKSVTTRKIIRDFAEASMPSLVFDFHGDMAANPPDNATVLNAADGLPFSPFDPDIDTIRPINSSAWEIAEVIAYVARLGEIQRNNVYRALQQIYVDHGWTGTTRGATVPTLVDFAEALETVEKGAAGRNARARLTTFTDFGLFANDASGSFKLRAQPPHSWVVDVSQLMEEVQRFAASFILRRVYREMFSWPQDATMKLAVVLDEAHRMARDVTLPKIMKEGRKFGVAVLVASQSADDFHKDVLGNAGTKVVFRTNYPASKTVAAIMRGRNGIDLSQEIEKLGVGIAYVSTPDSVQARKVFMSE